jgi:hypothetical protein
VIEPGSAKARSGLDGLWPERSRRGLVAASLAVGVALSALWAPVTARADADIAPLGPPDHVAIAVPDVDEAQRQLMAGTGTHLSPATSSVVSVRLPGEAGSRAVHLRRAVSSGVDCS